MNSENNKTFIYEKILNWIMVAAVFLIPVMFLPFGGISLYAIKISTLGLLSLVSLILFLSILLIKGKLTIPKEKIFIPMILIPVFGVVSAAINGSFLKSFFGSILEINTAAFWILGTLFALLISIAVRDFKTLSKSVFFFVLSSGIVLGIVLIKILISYGLPLQFINSFVPDYLSLSAVDTAVVLGSAMIIVLNALVFDVVKNKKAWAFSIALVVGALLFAGAVGFKPLIVLSAVFSLIHFVYSVSISKKSNDFSEGTEAGLHHSSVSAVSLAVIVISFVLILGGSSLSGFLSGIFKISNLEVRPNVSATVNLISDSTKSNPLFGVGPNNFSNLWNSHKPLGVNITNFWNIEFANGFGVLPTVIAEMGVLAGISIVVFLALLFLLGFKAIFTPIENPANRLVVTSTFFVAAYLWVMALIYPVGIVALSMAFVFTGLFIASVSTLQIYPSKEINLFANPKANFLSIFILVGIMILTVSAGFFVMKRVVGSAYFSQGQFAKASSISKSSFYSRESSKASLLALQNKLTALDPNSPIGNEVRIEIQNLISESVSHSKNAIELDPKNYENYLILGNIYESLSRFGVEGSVESAKLNYEEAKKLSPMNPSIPLAFARLSLIEGNEDLAFNYINESLILKPNFTDAFFLKAQIEVATNNIPSAIKSVEDATLVDPLNPGIYFQLGLLKYSTKDWRGASAAFERAVEIIPDYANARYFLGLSYYNLNQIEAAVAQFEEIQKTNPQNEETKLILENLLSNRAPFESVENQIDSEPEKREKLPISE